MRKSTTVGELPVGAAVAIYLYCVSGISLAFCYATESMLIAFFSYFNWVNMQIYLLIKVLEHIILVTR